MRIPLILVTSILLLSSCRKLVQDEFADFPSYPVINSILIPDSTIKVHVSMTDGLDTVPLDWVDNAEILLYIYGQFEGSMPYTGNGIYTSDTVVETGGKYSCSVSIPGFPVASCTDSIPEPTVLSNIVHTDNAGVDNEGITYPSVSFTLNNDLNKKEYFEVRINLIEYGTLNSASLIYIDDLVLLNEGLQIAVFSDELMHEGQYTMKLNYTSGQAGSINGGPIHARLFPFTLEIRSISYDLYMYLKQLYLYQTGRYPDIVGGVVTPFPLYSNVTNGYGIFAGYSTFVSDTIIPESIANEYGNEGE